MTVSNGWRVAGVLAARIGLLITGLPRLGPVDIPCETLRNSPMLVTTARYPTAHASKYLQQLCKHFAHKVDVTFDDTSGQVALPPGPAHMTADAEGLTIRIQSESAKDLIQARYVIDSHLVTFAHRDGFTGFVWVTDQA